MTRRSARIAQLTRRLCLDRLRAGRREAPGEEGTVGDEAVDETLAKLDETMTVRASIAPVGPRGPSTRAPTPTA